MKTSFIAHKNTRFVVNEGIKHIELREKNGTLIADFCCKKCLGQLKKAIRVLEEGV